MQRQESGATAREMSLLSNTTRQKVGNCLPEIKEEISREGGPKPAEKVLQISQEKIQNQAANEEALPQKLLEEGLRYNWGCVASPSSREERGSAIVSRREEKCGGFLFYRLSTSSAERTCRLGLR